MRFAEDIEIRPAALVDATPIARVQQASWRSAYADILDASLLANLSVENLAARIEQYLQKPQVHTLVAETALHQIVGFATCGHKRDDDMYISGELYAIYLLPDWQGRGIGRGLFLESVACLLQDNMTSMKLWAFAQNEYQAFYTKMGGKPLAEDELVLGGKAYPVRAYGWDDLEGLLA